MSAYFPSSNKPDVKGLVEALSQNTSDDALSRAVTPQQWETLGTYLQPFLVVESQVLITQGSQDRTVYFIETGSLSVHYEDDAGRVRLAIVGAGSAVGEGGFFSHLPRSASVQSVGASKLWRLTPIKFAELSNRQPSVALALVMGLGGLVSRRMLDQRKRIAVT
jgi:CRP/FNR family transcriptional regulator, cyclic AMP receptor protein